MSSQYQGFNWNGATGINGTLSLSNSFGVTQNSRVGIGTTTPSGSLSVTPPQYSIGTASQSGNTITGVGTAFTAAMVGSQFVFANGTSAGTITAFGSTTSLTVTISNTVTPAQAYSIGIGTASQLGYAITGVGTVFTTDMVGSQFVFANGTSAGTITGFTSPTILTVSTLQTVAVQAYYISYTGLQVSSTNGNVGIGTTVPTNILSLGNASAQKIWIENTATDVSGRALTVAAGGTVAGTSVNNVSGGQLILQSGSGTGTGDSSIAFQTATTLTTGTTLQTMSTKMTILGNGNVGIGTLTPNGALSVVSTNVSGLTTSSAINLVANSLTSGTGVYAASSTLTTGKLLDLQVSGTAAAASQTALNILTAGANATAAITTYGAQISNTHTNATSGTNVALYLNASGATTANYGLIVNAGNVGIGIAAPLAVLNVKDARNANSSNLLTSATGATVFIQPKSGSGYVIAFGSGPSDYPYMQFVTTDGLTASSMLLNPYGGNVGIGTTAPGQPLDVNGIIRSRGLVQFSDGTTVYGYVGKAGLWEGNADTNTCIAAEGANGLKFYTGGSGAFPKMSITPAGNVLIGSTTDQGNWKLQANGNLFIRGSDSLSATIGLYMDSSTGIPLFTVSNTGIATFGQLGTGTVSATAGVLSAASDSRLKDEDGFITDALTKVLALQPRYFKWKTDNSAGLPSCVRQLGFFAQEVQSALGEEVVNTPPEGGNYGIHDRGIIAMLTKAVQEQNDIIMNLMTRISILENK